MKNKPQIKAAEENKMSSVVLKTFRDSEGHEAVIQWEKGCVKYHAIAYGYGRFESWHKTISGAKQALKKFGFVEIKEQGGKVKLKKY